VALRLQFTLFFSVFVLFYKHSHSWFVKVHCLLLGCVAQ